ncbi:MAG: ribonuclease P protein component [Bacteroidetes bacterium]|nr:ribonuclease P protein component [Bacteroidota bacterium]MBL6943140.1 ribonuclease P protein component [Bacteroidales bacterium]
MVLKQTFKKSERLHSKLLIGKLFADGKSFFLYPFRVTFIKVPKREGPPAQILISVSKRNFKSAVTRNYIKRLVRESYRKNKTFVYDSYVDRPHHQLIISVVYIAKTIEPYSEIERKLILILHRLIEKDEGNNR